MVLLEVFESVLVACEWNYDGSRSIDQTFELHSIIQSHMFVGDAGGSLSSSFIEKHKKR